MNSYIQSCIARLNRLKLEKYTLSLKNINESFKK